MIRRSVLFAAILLGLAATSPAPAQQPDAPRDGLVTRASGADIAARVFARHGVTVPPQGQADTERLLEGLARKATE